MVNCGRGGYPAMMKVAVGDRGTSARHQLRV